MSKKEQESFDLEAVYDSEIAPLMTQIIGICKEHKMPMFASFAYQHVNSDNDTAFCTTAILPDTRSPEALEECVRVVKRPAGFVALMITTTKGQPNG